MLHAFNDSKKDRKNTIANVAYWILLWECNKTHTKLILLKKGWETTKRQLLDLALKYTQKFAMGKRQGHSGKKQILIQEISIKQPRVYQALDWHQGCLSTGLDMWTYMTSSRKSKYIPSTPSPMSITHSQTKSNINQHGNLKKYYSLSSVQFSRSVVSDALRPHESQHARPPCPSPTPGVHSDSRPSSLWCHPAISSSVVPFSSCPQSLPTAESFPMSQLFAWGGQSAW